METITQTINIVIGGDLASTGMNTTQYIVIAIALITTATLFLTYLKKPHIFKPSSFANLRKQTTKSFSIFALLVLISATLVANLASASAAPTLTLSNNQNNLTITVPQGGGKASTTTVLTSGTANPSGYTLKASLAQAEPGITIQLKGGDISTSTDLLPGAPALTLKAVNEASSNDTTEVTLNFSIDSTVTAGKKDLKLNYSISDNEVEVATMQGFTNTQCNALPTYNGTNEEAIVTLTDPRGNGRDYQVAKLADGNCWMLENLKLGSTTNSLLLTPADTNIASNLTLPQLVSPAFEGQPDEETVNHHFDDPIVFGPVPGDTNSGATNYGYLYNWSAATAGESRTSITTGNAQQSICPANWRLPTVYTDDTETSPYSGDYPSLDRAFGGTGAGASNGEENITQWQYDGVFKGVYSGYWGGDFDGQGGYGVLWSASSHPGGVDYAFVALFGSGEVNPAGDGGRYMGASVRCLLN